MPFVVAAKINESTKAKDPTQKEPDGPISVQVAQLSSDRYPNGPE